MRKSKILQLNNSYIQDEASKRRQMEYEVKQKNRFMALILVLVMFLFILPTYNLVESYNTLKQKEEQLVELEAKYDELSRQERIQSSLLTKLKDEEYIKKYIRAKYQYSKDGEMIYNIPGLLPK
ncbi:FtsB family cell division protein [Streptococcus cameli]